MKKKNHTLNKFVGFTLCSVILAIVFILLGTILSGSFNEGSYVVPNAVNWFNEFGTYIDAFEPLKGLIWDFTHPIASIVWYVAFVGTILLFVITFPLACSKKNGKCAFYSFLNLVFCAIGLWAFLGFYYSNYMNTFIDNGSIVSEYKDLLLFKDVGVANSWGWSIWAYILIVIFVCMIVGVIGTSIASIRACLATKEETLEQSITVPSNANETQKSKEDGDKQIDASKTEPKKKGVLILKRYDKYGQTGPVLESSDNSYPYQPLTSKPLTTEEIRNVIRDEFEKQEAAKLAEQYKDEKNAQLIAEAIVKASNNRNSVKENKPEETCACSHKELEQEKVIYPTPIVFAMPASAKEEIGVKEVKETKKTVDSPVNEKPKLTEERIKEIISEEITKALKDFVITKETIIQKPVEIKVPENSQAKVETDTSNNLVTEEKEEIKEEGNKAYEDNSLQENEVNDQEEKQTTVNEVVEKTPEVKADVVEEKVVDVPPVVEENSEKTEVKQEVIDETVHEEEPVTQEETQESEVTENKPTEDINDATAEDAKEEIPSDIPLTANGTPKIIRIPFTVRMESADETMRSNYNELKSLLKSYGLNNRVSNSGDTFRLHRVTYCKITIAGKSLKLYLALNPADYVDTTYPIKDASSKSIYKETPLVFKVKSGLSLRRAEELIRDCMDKHGLEQVKQMENRDWATDLNSVEFIDDDFDDADDEE